MKTRFDLIHALVLGLLAGCLAILTGCESSTAFTEPAEPERVLLDEDFTFSAGNWFTGTREGSYRFEYLDGEYRLQSWNDTGVVSSKTIPLPEVGGFDIQTTLTLRDAGDDLGYGFCWGWKDADNRTCFFLSGDGRFTVFNRTQGEIRELVPWTRSQLVEPGRNTLEIRKRDGALTCLINGGRAARVAHEPFAGSQVGFAGDGRIDFSADRLIILTE